jgi:hypothetical protein
MTTRAALALLILAAAPVAAAGQGLDRRVAATPDGTVRFTYEVRDGVEICTRGIRMNGDRMQWNGNGRWREDICRRGPAEVELRLEDGTVRDIDLLREGEDGTAGATDLGLVDAGDAARYFLALAGEARERVARDAIFPAMLADVPEVWRELLGLAKRRDLHRGVRTSALFWLGQEAAEAATEGLADVAFAEDEDQEVRDAAVFALSQRPHDEGVPILMELARTAEQAKTRKSAFFWLAQSDDPRVVPFFEEILLARRGG